MNRAFSSYLNTSHVNVQLYNAKFDAEFLHLNTSHVNVQCLPSKINYSCYLI